MTTGDDEGAGVTVGYRQDPRHLIDFNLYNRGRHTCRGAKYLPS
jgi:hypothetical protein